MNDTPTTAAWLLLFCFVPSSVAAALSVPGLPNKAQTAEIRVLQQAQTECSHDAPIEVIQEGKRTCIYQRLAHAGVTERIPARLKNESVPD